MKKLLITGGSGFIGSFIAQEAIRKNIVDKVVILDNFARFIDPTQNNFSDFVKLRFDGILDSVIIERGSCEHQSVLIECLEKHRPEIIIHLAALPLAKIQNLNTEEARTGSVNSTSLIMEILGRMKKNGSYTPSRLVYASSSMVYGDFVSDIASEEHPTNPKEIYGTMKLAGEVITKGLGEFYDIPFSIVRPSAVYGPTDINRRVSQIFIEKALNNQLINVHGADEKLDFTYVKDIASGFLLCATHQNAIGETFNITNGNAYTLLEYVEELKKYYPNLKYQILPRDSFRPKRGTLSIEKASRLLGYTPKFNLQKGLEEYIPFANKHFPRSI